MLAFLLDQCLAQVFLDVHLVRSKGVLNFDVPGDFIFLTAHESASDANRDLTIFFS